MKTRWLSALTALVVVTVGLASAPAFAQTTGDIEGTVVDSNSSPLPGVSVEAKSASLLGTRTVVTDASGRYRFPALPVGSYTVSANLSGFTKSEKTGVRVGLGAVANVPITLSVSVKEELVVTGEAPVIDVTRGVVGLSTSNEQIQKLPLGRNFVSIANTVAGTGTDAAGGVTVYGATSLENQYIIDGVNTTGIKIGDQGKTLNNEFVQEVEVKTGGYEAEYGRALGGIINVVTKSGGNEFHGDAFGYYDSGSLAADDAHVDDRTAVSAAQVLQPKRLDFGADLGGFFVKDRLWFFAAGNRVARDQDYSRVLARNYPGATGTITSTLKDGVDETRTTIFSGKLTFRLGESNTISASVFGDPGEFNGRQAATAGPDSAVIYTTKQGGTDFTAKWDGILGTQFLVQAQYGHHEEKAEDQSDFANSLGILQFRRGLTQYIPGAGPGFIQNEKYKRDGYKVAGTFFLGTHEAKVGFDYEHIGSTFSEKWTGPSTGGARIFQFLSAGGAFNYAYHRYFAKVPINCTAKFPLVDGSPDVSQPVQNGNFGALDPNVCAGWALAPSVDNPPTTKNLGLFAQDSWKILKNLTVNAGIRYEEQNLLDADGNSAIKLDGEWSPRIGFVYDFMNNGKSKLFGSYGRFYTTIPQDIQTRALGNEYTVISYNYTADHVDPIDFIYGHAFLQGGELTQSNLKGMYQDEIVAGLEYEVLKNWSFGIKGIYKSLGEAVEDRCDLTDPRLGLADLIPAGALTTCALVNPGNDGGKLTVIKDPSNPKCVSKTNAAGTPTELLGACESITPSRIYRGLELTATHRFSNNFYFLANYIYSKLEGNYSGNLSQTRETGQSDPNINADYDYIDLTPNAFGRLRNDRKHQFKASGTYSFPFGLSAGFSGTFATGRPMSVRGYARAGYTQERYLIPRGTYGDLPSTYKIDLHLEYALRIANISISPVVDVFNVTNYQGVTSRDEVYCTTAAGCAPLGVNYLTKAATNPNFNRDIAWQAPRIIRLGARVSF